MLLLHYNFTPCAVNSRKLHNIQLPLQTMKQDQANIWVVQGLDAVMIIGTGLGLCDLPASLESEGFIANHKPVEAVATQHIHFDHSGRLHRFENLAIRSSEVNTICHGDNFKTVTFMCDLEILKHLGENDGQVRSASSPGSLPRSWKKVMSWRDCRRLKVFHQLPGHSQGSIELVDTEARVLFRGDFD